MGNSLILQNFIVLEGLDGSGTTTQLSLVQEKLRSLKIPFLATKEPTNLPTGLFIRKVLKGEISLEPETLAFLFAADRHEHLYTKPDGILESLSQNRLVICDRYLFSSLAYQSINCNQELVEKINADFPLPELVFYLETPVEICQKRRQTRNSFEEIFEKIAFQKQVFHAYSEIWLKYNKIIKIVILDGNLAAENIAEKIWNEITKLPIIRNKQL